MHYFSFCLLVMMPLSALLIVNWINLKLKGIKWKRDCFIWLLINWGCFLADSSPTFSRQIARGRMEKRHEGGVCCSYQLRPNALLSSGIKMNLAQRKRLRGRKPWWGETYTSTKWLLTASRREKPLWELILVTGTEVFPAIFLWGPHSLLHHLRWD